MLVFRGLRITLFRHWNAFVDMMFVGFWAGTLSRKRCGFRFRGEKRIRMWFHYFAKRHVYMWKMWWKYVLFWYLTIQVLGYICIYCTYIFIIIYIHTYESSLSSTVCNSSRYSPKKTPWQKIQHLFEDVNLLWKMVIFQPAMWSFWGMSFFHFGNFNGTDSLKD